MKSIRYIFFLIMLLSILTPGQDLNSGDEGAYVDSSGVMRWKSSGSEVCLFGVNYTTPFAYSFRAHKRLGLDLKKAIDLDVMQMLRLHLDAFRVHVWDRQISDAEGNLLNNEHLDLFDYLLAKLELHGIKIILTPIAWWGTGWPEPDQKERGFSQIYNKLELITNQTARKAEMNYLRQFVNHVNPYTNKSYRDDRSIVAMEIVNEPNHPDDTAMVTDYINEMVQAIRNTGYSSPLIYNISENWNNAQANAVCKANVQGVSFQWYPTDLVHNSMLHGNYLPNVSKYTIPGDSVQGFKSKTKIVYEFDAADIGASYMYPAMARSFREAGMQFATMFSYDPVQIAWSNTEYPTHFLNLLYTPAKAIGLLIASRAFHSIPLEKSFGSYPANNNFLDFKVDYTADLSELNSETEFYYTNATTDTPKRIESLQHVAGCGNSAVIKYDGTGACFLDKLANGVWALELYPDVMWLRDPFEQTSLSRQAAKLFFNNRVFKVNLPDIGAAFSVRAADKPDIIIATAKESAVTLKPGRYILLANGQQGIDLTRYQIDRAPFLEGLYMPADSGSGAWVCNDTKSIIESEKEAEFKFRIASNDEISAASLYIRRFGWRGFQEFPLTKGNGFFWYAKVPGNVLKAGKAEYCVGIKKNDQTIVYPGEIASKPGNWDFPVASFWQAAIHGQGEPYPLFDADRDRHDIIFPHMSKSMRYMVDYVNGEGGMNTAIQLKITYTGQGEPFGMQMNIADLLKLPDMNVSYYDTLVIRARTSCTNGCLLGINCLLADGSIFGAKAPVTNIWEKIEIPLSAFKTTAALLLPNPYPRFLPLQRFSNGAAQNLQISGAEFLQVLCERPAVQLEAEQTAAEFEIESIYLKK